VSDALQQRLVDKRREQQLRAEGDLKALLATSSGRRELWRQCAPAFESCVSADLYRMAMLVAIHNEALRVIQRIEAIDRQGFVRVMAENRADVQQLEEELAAIRREHDEQH
jgi:hypothetical protein